jgi:spermidine synthase
MKKLLPLFLLSLGLPGATVAAPAAGDIIYETTSPYHHIRVWDNADGDRILLFDDTWESKMNLKDPNTGQFEYTEYFHLVWLWNQQIKSVLMLGLGGGSTQRTFVHYYPDVKFETVEIDPVVAQVAKDYFHYTLNDRQKLDVLDGRMFLRGSKDKYDAILLDAYTQGRYGASIPPHLVTKEFFQVVRDHLNPNGVLAYNVISTLREWNTDIVSAMFKTIKEVFPQVYAFQAKSSLNVVLIATTSANKTELPALRELAQKLIDAKKLTLPGIMDRVNALQPPPNYQNAPVLTDDFAPIESLMYTPGSATKAAPTPAAGNTTAKPAAGTTPAKN